MSWTKSYSTAGKLSNFDNYIKSILYFHKMIFHLEIREILRNLREENERRSCDVVDLWNNLSKRINDLGDESKLYFTYI